MIASESYGRVGGEPTLHPSCKLVVHVHVFHQKFISNRIML